MKYSAFLAYLDAEYDDKQTYREEQQMCYRLLEPVFVTEDAHQHIAQYAADVAPYGHGPEHHGPGSRYLGYAAAQHARPHDADRYPAHAAR